MYKVDVWNWNLVGLPENLTAMRISPFLIAFLLFVYSELFAQVAISSDNSAPNPASGLDVNFSDKGFLPPRMSTSQMNAIPSPPAGLMIYNTTLNTVCWFNGANWDMGTNRDGQNCGIINYGGKSYNTIIIGKQCWMAQNLNVGARINGTVNQSNNSIIEKYCYNDLESNCDIYGGLYQWNEMMNYTTSSNLNPSDRQGICPPGWHLPSDDEWCQVETYLDETVNCTGTGLRGTNAGAKMRETGTAHWMTPNTGATNLSEFTALPGGNRYYLNGGYTGLSYTAYFGETTESSSFITFFRYLSYDSQKAGRASDTKDYGFSVRCLSD